MSAFSGPELGAKRIAWHNLVTPMSLRQLTSLATQVDEHDPAFNVVLLNELEGRCLTELIKFETRLEATARNLHVMRNAGWDNTPEFEETRQGWQWLSTKVSHFMVKRRNVMEMKQHFQDIVDGV